MFIVQSDLSLHITTVTHQEAIMKIVTIAAALLLAGCGTVRQSDLDTWVGMPVEALDTHSFFLTLPMTKRVTAGGVEVRNYANTRVIQDCDDMAYAAPVRGGAASAYGATSCSSQKVGCNNIFYIKGGKVLEYVPTGQCRTDERVRPQKRYLDMIGK